MPDTHSLGSFIDAARGVCAVERVSGDGGWGGVVLDRAELLDASRGFAGYVGTMCMGMGMGTLERGRGVAVRMQA
jgi:hypothetical protein